MDPKIILVPKVCNKILETYAPTKPIELFIGPIPAVSLDVSKALNEVTADRIIAPPKSNKTDPTRSLKPLDGVSSLYPRDLLSY
jgi:hypothetical protein